MTMGNKLVLVTGAIGFVGKNLCSFLQKNDVLFRQTLRNFHVDAQPDSVTIGDINGETNWSGALKGVSEVVHLAARVHVVRENVAHPFLEFRQVNVEGTLNLARQAVEAGVQRFIFLSSIKVQGEDTTGKPFGCDDIPAPKDPYAVSKFEAEQGLKKIADETGLEVVVIRPPLVYGKGVGGNFRRLLLAVKRGVPLPFGAVKNKRSFVYVENLCDLIRECLGNKNAVGEILLVSDGQDVSTPQLLSLLARMHGSRLRLLNVPIWLLLFSAKVIGRATDMQRLLSDLQVDSSKTRELLKWQPPFSLEQGICRTIAGTHL